MRPLLLALLADAPVAAQDTLRVAPNPYDDVVHDRFVVRNLTSRPVTLDSLRLRAPGFRDWGFEGSGVLNGALLRTWTNCNGLYSTCREQFVGHALWGATFAPDDSLWLNATAFCGLCKTDAVTGLWADTLLLYTGGRRTPQRVVLQNPVIVAREDDARPGADGLHVFPNPARTRVEVVRHGLASGAEIRIADALGREVRRARVAPGLVRVVFDLRGLAPGVYGVSMGSGTRWEHARLVVR